MARALTIEPIGETIEVEEGQTVLDACLRAGIYLPHACCHGRCSTCKIDVLEGDVDLGEASSFALMDFEREEGKCLACTATLRSDVVIEADIEEEEDALYLPVQDHEGVVLERRMLTPTILGLTLEPAGGGAMPFQAGQYLQLSIPGVARPRAFSMANCATDAGVIELQIKRVPGGEGTAVLHDKIAEGDKLRFSGPYGHFFVRHSQKRPILLLAGGSGLSALRAMAQELRQRDDGVEVTLVHGARTSDELHGREELTALESAWPAFRYVPCLSADDDDSEIERGYVHEVLDRRFEGRFADKTAYVCGPPPMIEACIRTLMKGRLFEEHIFTEMFLNASNEEGAGARSPLFKRI